MRLPVLALILALPACISDAAIRAVDISTARPPRACERVVEGLHAHGDDRDDAEWDLRKRAVRAGANYVVPLDSGHDWNPVTAAVAPWSLGNQVTLTADAYACPDPAPPLRSTR